MSRTRRETDLESKFKAHLRQRLKGMFPGIIILINDPNYLQGVPDHLLLYGDKWAALEVKAFAEAEIQPNQPYYIDLMNRLSYAAFIYPENEEEILSELQYALKSSRNARSAIR